MEDTNNYLLFPLDVFWVSYPYCSYGKRIMIGTIGQENKVKSPGKGKVVSVEKIPSGHSIVLEYKLGKYIVKTKLYPIKKVRVGEGDNINQGNILGETSGSHLSIQIIRGAVPTDLMAINPMRILYLHPRQVNVDNIPYHTPKPLPRRYLDIRK